MQKLRSVNDIRLNTASFLLALTLLVPLGIHAADAPNADTWLTVAGDPQNQDADTVQVKPDTIVAFSELRTMQIRVNRSQPRPSYDGGPYRSYRAIAHIKCQTKDAKFRRLELYAGPLWTGASRTIEYQETKMPLMAFNDMRPNPNGRIIQAACTLQSVKSTLKS